LDFDAILRLTKVLKEASPSLQAKVCCVLEHLAASEQHATAMTATSTGSVIEAILEIGVIHGRENWSHSIERSLIQRNTTKISSLRKIASKECNVTSK